MTLKILASFYYFFWHAKAVSGIIENIPGLLPCPVHALEEHIICIYSNAFDMYPGRAHREARGLTSELGHAKAWETNTRYKLKMYSFLGKTNC